MKSPPDHTVNPVDLDFIKTRAQLVEIAAFLDRVDRSGQGDDFRSRALRSALSRLSENGPGRAAAILRDLSDQTAEPAASGSGAATGAPTPDSQ